jgi:acetoacetate decarboxylase
VVKAGWPGTSALELQHHALAQIASLPMLEMLCATYLIADITLDLGEVVHDDFA